LDLSPIDTPDICNVNDNADNFRILFRAYVCDVAIALIAQRDVKTFRSSDSHDAIVSRSSRFIGFVTKAQSKARQDEEADRETSVRRLFCVWQP